MKKNIKNERPEVLRWKKYPKGSSHRLAVGKMLAEARKKATKKRKKLSTG